MKISNLVKHWNPLLKPCPSFAVLGLRPKGNTDRSENLQIIEKLENILFYHFTTGTEFTLHIHLKCLPSPFEVHTLRIDVIAKYKPQPPSTGTKIRRFVSENSIYPRGSAAQWYPIQFSSTALSMSPNLFHFPFFSSKTKRRIEIFETGCCHPMRSAKKKCMNDFDQNWKVYA